MVCGLWNAVYHLESRVGQGRDLVPSTPARWDVIASNMMLISWSSSVFGKKSLGSEQVRRISISEIVAAWLPNQKTGCTHPCAWSLLIHWSSSIYSNLMTRGVLQAALWARSSQTKQVWELQSVVLLEPQWKALLSSCRHPSSGRGSLAHFRKGNTGVAMSSRSMLVTVHWCQEGSR